MTPRELVLELITLLAESELLYRLAPLPPDLELRRRNLIIMAAVVRSQLWAMECQPAEVN